MNNAMVYIISFIEGILTFISPCILPLIPVYMFYLAGTAANDADSSPKKGGMAVVNSLGFVIGFTIIFILLGAAATSLGQFLKGHIDLFRKVSGVIMVIFGLSFAGAFRLSFLNLNRQFEHKFKKPGFASAVVFGFAFGFSWTPCLTAFLGSILIMAANMDTLMQGIVLLTLYSLGLGAPFILCAVVLKQIEAGLALIKRHNRVTGIISGLLMIAAGILVYTDSFKYIGTIGG
jgi:cytochrome c-type biogenesis protein